MKERLHHLATLFCVAAIAAVAAPCAAAAAEAPLSPSNYAIRAACPPPSRLHAGCLALQLVPRSAQARAYNRPIGITRASTGAVPAAHNPAVGDFGLRPADLHTAYSLPAGAPGEQTIALVDAYNDPTAEADLATYSAMFGIAACTKENGCFKKVGESGSESTLPFPKSKVELESAEAGTSGQKELARDAVGWGAEISLDIESAHAVCPNCHILLVEASTPGYADLEKAVETAEALGAGEVSNSWGGPEEGITPAHDAASPFNDPRVVITASSGDNGFLGWDAENASEAGFTNYPAASPHVVAVGGTRLTLGAGSKWASETVWNGSGASGGGCSVQFTAPPWQQAQSDWAEIGCTNKRVVADVAADADPHTGIAVTDSSKACETEYAEGGTKHVIHWCTYGGTSLASPIIAAVFALAGGSNGANYPAHTLYENELAAPGALHDVTAGSNGECESFNPETGLTECEPSAEAKSSCAGAGSCLAGTGFDGPTGVGTPHGIGAFVAGEGAGGEELPEGESPEEKAKEKAKEKIEEKTRGTEGSSSFPVPPPPGAVSPPAPRTTSPTPVVSALALTVRAVIALNSHRPQASKLTFFFVLTAPAHVKLALTRRLRIHHRAHWTTVGSTATVSALAGRNGAHVVGRARLAPGLYRLSVTPLGGRPRTILLHIN